jgi:hypothetical protein
MGNQNLLEIQYVGMESHIVLATMSIAGFIAGGYGESLIA